MINFRHGSELWSDAMDIVDKGRAFGLDLDISDIYWVDGLFLIDGMEADAWIEHMVLD